MITICSYCKKFQDPVSGNWEEIQNPKAEVKHADNITHGICPDCLEKELAKINKD